MRKRYFANVETKIYHDANSKGDACRESEILVTNRAHFGTATEAILAGYHACKICVKEEA